MLADLHVVICPWCGETAERDVSNDPDPEMETSRSPMMVVLRLRRELNGQCAKCGSAWRVTSSMEQLWSEPKGADDAT